MRSSPVSSQRGAASMLAIVIMSTIFFLIVSGLALVQMSKRSIGLQLTYHGQALNAAQAGLVDALSWFRRQNLQPVATFAPVRDTTANPPINDTDDPTIGLVRDYEISSLGNVWGRFETRHSRVRDASRARGKDATGVIWEVDSVGIVFTRQDPAKSYNQFPNRVLSSTAMRSEIQRLGLVLPANAAISASVASDIAIGAATRVSGGGGIGVAYPPGTGSATLSGDITGSPSTNEVDPYQDSIEDVFGVSQQELISMADIVAPSQNEVPDILPDMSLTVLTGDAIFWADKPLIGTGILVVLGDLNLAAGSLSNFNGLIYVAGDYSQSAPSQVSGAIVARGKVTINASGDLSEVYFDGALLSQIQRQMGQYRFSRSAILIAN